MSVEVRRARARAQLLAEREPRPVVEVARTLLAVQAQDPRSLALALHARSAATSPQPRAAAAADGPSPDSLSAALAERSVVMSWLVRGTLHLVAAEDWPWLLALTAPRQAAGSARRLGQLGVAPDEAERAVALIARATADDGPLTRTELGERLAAAGIRTEGQALPHLLGRAAWAGAIVVCGEHRYANARAWLGAPPAAVDRDTALAELARRYLRAHAPASDADLAAWSGLPLRDVRAGLHAAGLDPATAAPAPEAPLPPRLLPAFDPYLLGWKDRAFAVPPEHARRVHPGGGMLRATVIDDGRAVATWSLRAGRVAVVPFDAETPLPDLADEIAAVEAHAGARP